MEFWLYIPGELLKYALSRRHLSWYSISLKTWHCSETSGPSFHNLTPLSFSLSVLHLHDAQVDESKVLAALLTSSFSRV